MPSQSLEGSAASTFIKESLVLKHTDSVRWQATYKDPSTGQLWLLDYPDSSYHGASSPRLRPLPLDRQAILELLLLNLHLNMRERQQLGTNHALESELSEIVESQFRRHGWYPPVRRPWPVNGSVYDGHILERVDENVTRLWMQRDSPIPSGRIVAQTQTTFSNVAEAVRAFIQREWPDQQIDGIQIQPG